ncbi:MAG: BON domain-containing protein [Pirellulales bacterium]|nr:BON domain-containing protein [Planctomycetales bacterium]
MRLVAQLACTSVKAGNLAAHRRDSANFQWLGWSKWDVRADLEFVTSASRRAGLVPPPHNELSEQTMATAQIEVGDLSDRVQKALFDNPHVPSRDLRFETTEGRVTIRGTVGSFYHKQAAQEALRRIDGIQRIDNELEVNWR